MVGEGLMRPAAQSPATRDPAAVVLGYLNFSSGAFDPAAWRAMNALFAELEPAGEEGVVERPNGAGQVARLLTDRLATLETESQAFRDATQARAVIGASASALAGLVVGVARALELASPRVSGVGGALGHLDQLRLGFGACLARELPAAALVTPRGDACWGALELAHSLAAGPAAQEPG
jgi:hypothetical protein